MTLLEVINARQIHILTDLINRPCEHLYPIDDLIERRREMMNGKFIGFLCKVE